MVSRNDTIRSLALELAHHDRGEDARIDVAAAQDQPDLAAAEALRLGQHRGKPGGARAFRHRLLQREIGVDRALDDAPRRPARSRTTSSRTIGSVSLPTFFTAMPSASVGAAERPLLAVQRVPERRIERRLRADDLDRRLERARRDRDAGDQPAAADRDHQHVEVGHILQHLERDGALPGDDMRIVVRMHPGQAALARQRLGARLRLGDASRRRARPPRHAPASPRPSRTASSPASRWSPGCRAAPRDRRPPGHGCRPTWR